MAADDLHYDWSPGGAHGVEIEWIIPESGRFGRDRHVARSDATHARITEHGGSDEGERLVTRGEADAYIAELERAATEHTAQEHEKDLQRTEWMAGMVSTCSHCGDEPRRYDGLHRLQSGGVGAEMVFGTLSVSNIDLHIYTCGHCGSVELFQTSSPQHPFAGNASA